MADDTEHLQDELIKAFRRSDRHDSGLKFQPVVPWLLAALFLLLWLFDAGRGPFNTDRVGTLGQWITGLGAIGALIIAIREVIAERRTRNLELIATLWDQLFPPTQLTETPETEHSERYVLLRFTPTVSDDGESTDLHVSVRNYDDAPMVDFACSLRGTRGRPLKELQELRRGGPANWPPDMFSLAVTSHVIIAPGTEEESVTTLNYPPGVLDQRGVFRATWKIGSTSFLHTEDFGAETWIRSIIDQ